MKWTFYTSDGLIKTSATGGGGATDLDGLSDVTIAGVAQGDILARDATDFKNVNIATNSVVARITGEVGGLVVAPSRFIGRLAAGVLAALTSAQVKTELAITASDVSGVATTELDNLGTVAINANLISDTDSTDSLGSTGIKWLDAFLDRATFDEAAAPATPATGDVRLYAKTDKLLYSKDDAGLETLVSGGSGGGGTDYILLIDQKPDNTDGGTFTNLVWQPRDINTEISDDGGHASIAINQITLAAGTYRFKIITPAYRVGRHMARLQNVTDATTIQEGTAEYAGSAEQITTHSTIAGRFTIGGVRTFEVQHQSQITRATDGFGARTNFITLNETYTLAEFWKEL